MFYVPKKPRARKIINKFYDECIALKQLMNNIMPLPTHISMTEHLQRILDTEAHFNILFQSAIDDINSGQAMQSLYGDKLFTMINNLITDKYCGSYDRYTCDELFMSRESGNFCKTQVEDSQKCNELKEILAVFIYKILADANNNRDFWWPNE